MIKPKNVSEGIDGNEQERIIEIGHRILTDSAKKMKEGRKADCGSTSKAVYFEIPFDNKLGKNVIGITPSLGCSYNVCTMCNYGGYPQLGKLPNEAYIQLIKDEFEKTLTPAYRFYNKGSFVQMFNILPAGSWFDSREVPDEAREYIENRMAEVIEETNKDKKALKVIFATESRLEYITEEKIKGIRKRLGNNTIIEVGYGMESANEFVNEALLNKRLPNNYRAKIEIMLENGFDVAVHVFFGQPVLTERERIEDVAYSLVKIAEEKPKRGTIPLLMVGNVKEQSVTGYLYERGEYQLPKLWSVAKAIEIAGETDLMSLDGLMIHGFSSNIDQVTATNCPKCTGKVTDLLKSIKLYSKPEEKLEVAKSILSIDCECKKEWEKELEKEPESLRDRTLHMYDMLARDLLGKDIKDFER
jgi:radical SAM enzyme (TIGR01210 family)